MISLGNCYIGYVNLKERIDRNEHMQNELARIGLEAHRKNAYTPQFIKSVVQPSKIQKMLDTTPGACGCMYSQMDIITDGITFGKSPIVLEDDVVFASDTIERINLFFDWLNNNDPDFDVAWLGCTVHKEPRWHKLGHQQNLPCDCSLNKDWEPTNNINIIRTYGIWSTFAYVVNIKSADKILKMLHDIMPQSIGIDFSFIALQPKLRTYAFCPGITKQFDNISNIGSGVTRFSGFASLGQHWFQDSYVKGKNYME